VRRGCGYLCISDADTALLELDDPLAPNLGIFFAGWSRADRAPRAAVAIHHPGVEEKRISFEDDPTTITGFGRTSGGTPTHLRVADWDLGTTEPGSSGSPLFDENQRVVGVLSGGFAACGNDLPDWYGRLHTAWDGATSATRLRDWLDPAGTGAFAVEGLDGTTLPVTLAAFTAQAEGRHLRLAWATAGEANNAGFEVQLAASGEAFRNVGFVAGAGTTGEPHSYTFRTKPLLPGAYRVRLRQVDRDGAASVSSVLRAEVGLGAPVVLEPAFPHPATGGQAVTVAFGAQAAQPVEVALYDALGRRVRTVYRGTPPLGALARVTLPTHDLASGVYVLRLTSREGHATRRLTVIR
jgi:lysyl endopeptidase